MFSILAVVIPILLFAYTVKWSVETYKKRAKSREAFMVAAHDLDGYLNACKAIPSKYNINTLNKLRDAHDDSFNVMMEQKDGHGLALLCTAAAGLCMVVVLYIAFFETFTVPIFEQHCQCSIASERRMIPSLDLRR